jgi:hypothetical protein
LQHPLPSALWLLAQTISEAEELAASFSRWVQLLSNGTATSSLVPSAMLLQLLLVPEPSTQGTWPSATTLLTLPAVKLSWMVHGSCKHVLEACSVLLGLCAPFG